MNPVVQTFAGNARATPDAPLLILDEGTLSYGEALAQGNRALAGLRARGIGRGETVAIAAEKHTGFLPTYLALHAIGAIAVPVNPKARAEENRALIETAAASWIVSSVADAASPLGIQGITFDELSASAAGDGGMEQSITALDDPADLIFTTGTTGTRKGVLVSHRALSAAARNINTVLGNGSDDLEVLPLPLYHSFGLGRLRCIVTAGGAVAFCDGFSNPDRILSQIVTLSATGLASVPAGLAILLDRLGERLGEAAAYLRYLEIGSSAMPEAQKRRLMALLPDTRICMHYGLTEASRSCFLVFHEHSNHLATIGKPAPGVEVRVVDDDGEPVGIDEPGYLEVRGEHVLTEYWRDTKRTAATLHAGWVRTGDLGSRDSDGFLTLRGREGDVINIGGKKVSPEEVEAILESHPAVAECACVGVPDPDGITGEVIKAFLVAAPGAAEPRLAELAKLIRKTAEPYKVPRQFQWVDALPRTESGKLQRRRLAEG